VCLILFSLDAHTRFPLVIAANRDEAHARPAAPAGFWDDHPCVLAGRDLDQHGTWLGITRSGRWAALTNFRQGGSYRADAPSRGRLVAGFLSGKDAPLDYLSRLAPQAGSYNGFNLLAGTLTEVWYLSNRESIPRRVERGVHGLSNHLLDTPWPKVVDGRRRLETLGESERDAVTSHLLDGLADRRQADPATLPDTGVGLSREKALSPAFISAQDYGTRASTVVLVDGSGQVTFTERSFGPLGRLQGEVRHEFALSAGAMTSGPR